MDERCARAREVYERLTAGEYERVTANLTPALEGSLPPERLASNWRQLGSGPPTLQGIETLGEEATVVRFERDDGAFRIVVTFDDAGRVAALLFQSADDPLPMEYAPPAYESERVTATEVTVPVEGETLHAELVEPPGSDPRPCVVILPGSGSTDMDGASGQAKPYRDLAYGLASNGVSTLRYTKRPVSDTETAEGRLVADAVAVVSFAAQRDRTDRVLVCGHSLGGFVAPLVCHHTTASEAILLGAPAGDLVETAVGQLDADVSAASLHEVIESESAATRLLGYPISFWRGVRDERPADRAGTAGLRLFVGYGGCDELVGRESFDRWADADTAVTANAYPPLSHELLPSDDGVVHIPERVVSDIAGWVTA